MKCEICGKTTAFGKKVTHDRMYVNGRSSRTFKPNLQKTTIVENGIKKKVTACTRCIRTNNKNNMPRN